MLIDSHAHLDDKRFDGDREELIESLRDKGVDGFINIGIDLESSRKSIELAEKYDFIHATVGFHPHEAKRLNEENFEKLRKLSRNNKVVAIGEIGLDYYYDNSPRDVQKYWFKRQLELAKEEDLPVVIHSREATEDTYNILKEAQDGSLRGVLHCYSGSTEMAFKYIDLGFYISLAGPVTFKNAIVPKEVARMVDINRLLIETDSPYLTPEPHRGKRNDPGKVIHVAEEIASLRNMSLEDLGRKTSENTRKLFKLD